MNFLSVNAQKTTKFKMRISDKNEAEDYMQTICVSSKHNKDICKVSKESV